uniref:Uncharacterized protein n=1 Tax=Anguilla anguilla TaxID=7936 RepID=A0A0E9UR84_ANGAN
MSTKYLSVSDLEWIKTRTKSHLSTFIWKMRLKALAW